MLAYKGRSAQAQMAYCGRHSSASMRVLTRIMAAIVASASTGCALNPYIADTRPPSAPVVAAPAATQAAPGSLQYALAYADSTYIAYRAKLGEEYERQRALSNGLLTLGALTAGAVIGHAHRDVVITAALSGALAYQLGTWNTNDGRLGIYLEGMKAMACVKSAVAPLRMSDESRLRIDAAEKGVLNAMNAGSTALSETTKWLHIAGASQSPNSETAQTARAEIAEASAQFTQASELLKLSSGLQQKIDGGGAALEPRIQEIIRLIDDALRGTQANLNALPQHIAGILKYTNVFAPGLKLDTLFNDRIAALNPAPPAPGSGTNEGGRNRSTTPRAAPLPLEPRDQLAAALGELRKARVLLAARVAVLSGAIERPNSQVQADLAGCGVDSVKLSHGLRLDRNQIRLTAGQARTSQIGVEGATLPLTASLQDLPAKGINVSMAGSDAVLVVADASTVAGSSYQVKVEDAANATALLTITVEATGAGTPAAPTGRECTGPRVTDRPLLCLIQNIQHLQTTGELDLATCQKVIEKYASTGVIDDTTRSTVLTQRGLGADASDAKIGEALSSKERTNCKLAGTNERGRIAPPKPPKPPAAQPLAGARNDFERRLGGGDLLVISQGIGMKTPTRELSDDFRRAVADYQKRNGLADTKGELNAEFAKKWLK